MKLLQVFLSFLFYACSGESPLENFEEDAYDIERNQYNEENETAYERCVKNNYYDGRNCCDSYGNYTCYSSSSKTDYEVVKSELQLCSEKYNSTCCNNCYEDLHTYQCKYCTDKFYDAYGKYLCSATTIEKTIKFTLTEYRQLEKMDANNLTDGDPIISFILTFIKSDGTKIENKTGNLLELSNKGSWSGEIFVLYTVPATTDTIKVCPILLEDDPLSDDEEYNSGYCYIETKLNALNDYEVVYQKDYKATYYNLYMNFLLRISLGKKQSLFYTLIKKSTVIDHGFT